MINDIPSLENLTSNDWRSEKIKHFFLWIINTSHKWCLPIVKITKDHNMWIMFNGKKGEW